MTATWLQCVLIVLDVLGLVVVVFGEVVQRVWPAFSEPLLVEIGGNLLLIGSFAAGNYVAFARLLEQKMELGARLRKSGPRVVPADLSSEPGARPDLRLTVRNSAEQDAINVSLYLQWDDRTFLCLASCISSGGLYTWNLGGDCASRRRIESPRANRLSRKLANAKEPVAGQAGSQVTEGGCWLFMEYCDAQQNVYQTVSSYDEDAWETHYAGLATV
jgi:hypothetical protein